MDFKKISRIFIIAFTLLNLYLIYSIFKRQDVQYTTLQPQSSDVFKNMEELEIKLPNMENTMINNRDIFSIQVNDHDLLQKEISENKKLTGNLNDKQEYYDSFPSKPIILKGNPEEGFVDSDYERLREFISSNNVMFGSEYSNLRYEPESRRFVLNQLVNNIPITDGTSEVSLFVNEEGEIYAFQQTYAGPTTEQGRPLDLIEASRAIELLFLNNKIKAGSEVSNPELTYRRVLNLEDLSMYSPMWAIDILEEDERISFIVDAVDGSIVNLSDIDLEVELEEIEEDSEEDPEEEAPEDEIESREEE